MNKKLFSLLLAGCLINFAAPGEAEEIKNSGQAINAENSGTEVHAQPWAFGHSADRNEKIWKKGVDSNVFFKKNPKDKMAIIDGKTAAREQAAKNRNKKVGLSFKDESGAWKVAPERKDLRPDEARVRDNRHVLSAFANVEASDDLSFRLGPELILRDDKNGEEAARSDQPDSAFGLGMKFKYDF